MRLSRLHLNSFWLLCSRIGIQLGMAVFTILVARGLGASGFGQYAFIASIIVVGNTLTTFGTDMHLVREIAATNDLSGLSPALAVQLLLSALFILAAVFGSTFLPERGEAGALRIYALSLLPLAFYTVFTTALRGLQRMRAYSLLSLAAMLLQMLAAAWVFARRADVQVLAGSLLLVQVLSACIAALAFFAGSPPLRFAWRVTAEAIRALLRPSAPIAVLGILGIAYQRLVLLVLPVLAGTSQAGWFSAAARIVEAAKIGHLAVLTALYPAMAQFRSSGDEAWGASFRRPALLLIAAAFAGSLALWLLAPLLVPLLFGPEYDPGVAVLRVLAWILVPYAVNSFLTLAFLARGEERVVLHALAAGLLLLGGLIAWLSPARGAQGAAWAALGAEAAQSLVLLAAGWRGRQVLRSLLFPRAPTESPARLD